MATHERQTIRQMRALLGMALVIGVTMAFSSAKANELTCESSHLSASPPNLEQIVGNLAKLRLQTYHMPNSSEKSRADQEFKAKYAEFENLVGDKEKARERFMAQMKLSRQAQTLDPLQQAELREKEQREREKKAMDPFSLSQKMEFHEIDPGTFTMGRHQKNRVEIRKPFAMMSTQVTQMMWAQIQVALGEIDAAKINPSKFKDGAESIAATVGPFKIQMRPNHPVEMVSWDDVVDLIHGLNRLSRSDVPEIQTLLQKLIPEHRPNDIYDLPTKTQWEFVMRNRGKSEAEFFDREDESELSRYAWYDEKAQNQTHAVAQLLPRMIEGQEFYDLEGNVMELTKDAWDQKNIPILGVPDPLQTNGEYRVVRGGAWSSTSQWPLASGSESQVKHDRRSESIGFRLVRIRP